MKLKKLIAALAFGLVCVAAHADAPVIRCDPNATGAAQYPNVSCTSNGFLNVNASVSAGATSGAAANGAAVSGNPVLVAGYDGTLVRTLKTDTNGQLFVNSAPTSSTLVDHSGTITTGGTSQTLSAAKTRKYLMIQNISSNYLYINFTSAAAATTGSIAILPNAVFVQEGNFVSSELITIFGATTGQAFTAKDF